MQTVEYEMLLKGMEKPVATEESYMTTSEILNYLRGYTTLNLSERRMGEALKKAGFLRKSKRIGGNPYFKGCLPPSDVSYVPSPSEQINLFEGFMDYLSLLTMSPDEEKKAALILNSINNIKKSRFLLSKHKFICSYLDNDDGGKRTLEQLKRDGFDVQDCSSVFRNYKDLNEYLCAEFKHSEKAKNKKAKGIKL